MQNLISRLLASFTLSISLLLPLQAQQFNDDGKDDPTSIVFNPEQSIVTSEPPAGFEDLLGPQLTLVDIYYNNVLVGASMATYTAESIELESPHEVMALIPDVIDPAPLALLLSIPQQTHQDRVCFYSGQTNCGVLSPAEIGLIFDESQLRVDIFINPQLLKTQALVIEKYLPPSKSGTSFISGISLVASGGEQRDDVYSANLNSLLSINNYRLQANIESDSERNTRLDQLSLTYERENLAYQVGSFRTITQSSGFFEQRDFLGVRVQSSLATRTDLEQVSGTQLFVFLSERSRIEIFKDGQIIDTQIYQAGNIELDTRSFPDGAYTVELKIIGDSGKEKIESHFYSKSLQLPPIDETLFFVEVGYPEDDSLEAYPVAKKQALGRLGMISRVTDYFGYSSALVKNSQQQMFELGSYWLGNQIEFQTNHAFASDSQHAAYYLLGLRHPKFFLSASYRRSYSEELPLLDDDLRLIHKNSRQTLVNIGVPFGNATLNLYATTRQQEGFDDLHTIGLSWRKNIFRSGRMLLDWTVDATKQKDEQRIMTGLTLRFISNHISLDSSLRYNQYQSQTLDTSHLDKNVRVSYRDAESAYGVLNNSVDVTQTAEQLSASFQSEISNDYGYGRLTLDHIQTDGDASNNISNDSSRNGYSIASHFNLVAGGGKVALGGDRQNAAGVMLDLTSIQSADLYFAVIVNDIEMTRVKAGDTSFVALSPYQTYRVVLSPIGETLVQFDNTRREFTLYPGNVESLAWDVEKVSVVVMQLIDMNNQVFKNARLKMNNSYAITDDLGWIQMELSLPGKLEFVGESGKICIIELDEAELSETVNYLGEKNCLIADKVDPK